MSSDEANDEETEAYLKANGIDMEPAFTRLREIVDQHKRKAQPNGETPMSSDEVKRQDVGGRG